MADHSLLDLVGDTPLVRLRGLTGGLAATVLVKVEYLNPGGSVKDRAATAMVLAGGWLANQYDNPANPEVHYATTGAEIWAATDGRVTHFGAGIGTGGTISGTGRFLKEKGECEVVGRTR